MVCKWLALYDQFHTSWLTEQVKGPQEGMNFNTTGHIRPSYQQGGMNDDMMKHPPEHNQNLDSNPQPLAHKASMLPLTHAGRQDHKEGGVSYQQIRKTSTPFSGVQSVKLLTFMWIPF